jgi:predicted MFS family arabinose efflux permease
MASGSRIGLAVAWITLFVVGTDLFVVSPLLPMIAADYGLSPARAGAAVTIFCVVYMVIAPVLGHIADRIGRRRVLICGLVAFGIANLLTALAASFVWLLVARLVAGATAAAIAPSLYALVGGAAPPERRATWLAVAVSGLLISLSLGAPIGALIGESFGWTTVFAVLAVLSLGLAAANLRAWPPDTLAAPAQGPHRAALTAATLAQRLAPTVIWSTALYGVYTYLGAGLAAAGYPTADIARVVGFYGCGALAGTFIGGRLADRYGARFATGASLAALAACLLVVPIALRGGILVDLAFGLTSLVAQLFFPAQQAGLANDFPAQRATVLAWNNSALFLGISLGSVIGGQAIALGQFEANLAVGAVIALAGWLINAMVAPRPRPALSAPR